jgi:archaellum biogenesis protein FlaJ (TadC family)
MDNIEQMNHYMRHYFAAEKSESALFVVIGLAAVLISVMIYLKAPAYRGMIAPLLLIAVIQIAVGGGVYLRTDSQVEQLEAKLKSEADAYRSGEILRMDAVMKNFKIYKAIEIALLLGGIILTFAFSKKDFLYAMGIGLIIQPAIMLLLDLLAEKRADHYIGFITSLPGSS